MIKTDLADLIQIIPDIIGLFLPGYIVVALCNWLINNKMDIYIIGIWSLVISYLIQNFYSAIHIFLITDVDINESIKIVIYIITALIVPFCIVEIYNCNYIKKYLEKYNHKSIFNDVFKATIDYKQRTIMHIYLKNSNVMYSGIFKYNEENGVNSYIVLINYTSYKTDSDSFEIMSDAQGGNVKSSVIINMQDIERIELIYEDNSEVWKWLNENN